MQQHGIPPHSVRVEGQYWDDFFSNIWIGRRPPDLTPLDSFVATKLGNLDDLKKID